MVLKFSVTDFKWLLFTTIAFKNYLVYIQLL